MKVTDSASIDDIMDYGVDQGLSLGEIEAAITHAAVQEWVLLFGDRAHLSLAGYRLIGPANDNSE